MEDILAIILIFGGGTAVAIAFSPIGKAIADRIRGRAVEGETDPAVLAEFDDVRAQLSELHERMEFSERLLAKGREAAPIEAGGNS